MNSLVNYLKLIVSKKDLCKIAYNQYKSCKITSKKFYELKNKIYENKLNNYDYLFILNNCKEL